MAGVTPALHFVIPQAALWPELAAGRPEDIGPEALKVHTVGSLNGWVVRSYYELLRRGHKVTQSDQLRLDAINVVSPRDFGRRQRGWQAFVLVPRADGHRPMLANFFLEQNTGLAPGGRSDVVSYWPQADIRPRRPERGARVEVLAFKGRVTNLDLPFRDEAFQGALAARGARLEMDAFSGLLGGHQWNDYSETDVILAVRNMTRADALHKPPSKLTNAWFGEVPAILGPEPAFRALRRSELDYLEVRSPAEALAALDHLRAHPDHYRRMVENGRARREAFTADAVVAQWLALVEGRIGAAFARWQRLPSWMRAGLVLPGMLVEPVSKAIYRRRIEDGRRILSD